MLSRVRLFATPWTISRQAPSGKNTGEGVGISFSRGSSQPKDRTQVSCITGRFFTIWTTREASDFLKKARKQKSKVTVGFPGGASGKEPTCPCRRRSLNPWVGKMPWRRAWQPTPVFPWTEELGGLQFIGLHRVGHDWNDLARTHTRWLYVGERWRKRGWSSDADEDCRDSTQMKGLYHPLNSLLCSTTVFNSKRHSANHTQTLGSCNGPIC